MTASPERPIRPWWADGLPFECQQSGRCCHQRGEYGHVYVNYQERSLLAEQLNITLGEFTKKYTNSEDDGSRVLRFVDGHCIFLRGSACQVHAAKPVQCRTWPFWKELLESEQSYQTEVRNFCPGSRTGTVVPAESIQAQMLETEAALWEV
jgi:uncharacterized protein